MVEILRQILADAIANGATPEQQQRIQDAIASATAADRERARQSSNASQEFQRILDERAAASQSYSRDYVAARQREMAAEEEALRQAEETANLFEQLTGERNAGLDEQIRIQRAANIQMREQAAAADAAAESATNFMKGIGFGKSFNDSFLGQMFIAGPEGFAAIGAAMADNLNIQSLFASGLYKMQAATIELFNAFDKSQAKLSETTATTGEYNDLLYDLQESNKAFGVDSEIAGEAIGSLFTELSSFNQMGAETQKQLATTTAQMTALGVSTGTGAKQFDNMIQGMGMTATMANDASMELIALGDSIGMAADTISQGFNAAAQELAKYGSDAIDVFKGLGAAAKATGIEMGALMGITKQFDTFEGAAQGAGKLNAILGGGVINSMDLLNGTEEERIRLLIQSINASGKNFENLNRFEKQAIASAAGISDMTEANKLFSMSLSAYDDMQRKAQGASAESAKLQERAQAAQTFMEKLKMIGQAFAVGFMPVLELFHGFANIILELNDMTGGLFIPVMVGLVGIFALLSRVNQINNMAMAAGTGIQFARTAATSGLAAAQAGLSTATNTNTVSTQTAIPTMYQMGFALRFTLQPIIPMIPAIISLGLAFAALGLAIAAPFIAIAAIVTSFTQLFTAMLEAPKAIAAAIAGLIGFAVAASAALIILAYGMAAAVTVLVPFAFQMIIVAPALMQFSMAVAVAAGAFYLLAMGLERLGQALVVWSKVELGSLLMAAGAIALFLGVLIPLATPAMTVGALVGVPLFLFGIGLEQFAKGIVEFNKVGFGALAMAALSVASFVYMMIAIAAQTATVSALVGIPLLIFGMGLQQFGKAIAEFNKVGLTDMLLAAASLGIFAAMLIPITAQLGISAALVGIPLYIFALGLLKFGEGLRAFRKVGLDDMLIAVASLGIFAFMLMKVTVQMMVAGLAVGIPLYILSVALLKFARAMRKFNAVGIGAIAAMVYSLMALAVSLIIVALPLMVGALLVGIPLLILGTALQEFAKGVAKFNRVGGGAILAMGFSLLMLGAVLRKASPQIAIFGLLVAVPLYVLGLALITFSKALRKFARVDFAAALGGFLALAYMGVVIAPLGILFAAFAIPFSLGLLAISMGLMGFGMALQAFSGVGIGTILVAIAALTLFGAAMAFFIFTGLIGYMIAGFYMLSYPLMLFGFGLFLVGAGLVMIQEGLSGLFALSEVLGVIAQIGFFGAAAMGMIASSIFGIALALMFIPESKAISFGFAMEGYGAAMAAVAALTPETVELAEKIVVAAGEYAEIQATMNMPDEDSFVQAMKNAFGLGDKKGGGGQDIILKLNGRELGRAIDAQINKNHNLSID